MKKRLGKLGFRWWQTIGEYQSPDNLGMLSQLIILTRYWREQRCALSGLTRRQYFNGVRWITGKI